MPSASLSRVQRTKGAPSIRRSDVIGWARRIGPTLPPVAIFFAILLNGLNNALGQAVACIFAAVPAIFLLLSDPPPMRLWERVWPALAIGVLGITWTLFVSIPWAGMLGPGWPAPFAPDFVGGQLLWQIAALASLLSGIVIGASRRRAARSLDWLIALICLHLLIGLVVRGLGSNGLFDFWSLERDGRFQGTIGNVNVTATVAGAAGILALTRLPALARRIAARRSMQHVAARIFLYGFSLLVTLGALIATASRFPTIATILALAVLAVILSVRDRRYVRPLRLVVAAGAILLGFLLLFDAELLADRMSAIPAAFQVREMLWAQYFDVAMRSPLYGYGLGSFTSVNEHFVTDVTVAEQSWRVNSPHSLVLQLLLVGGVPYLLLTTAAAVVVMRDIVRGGRRWIAEEIGLAIAIAMILSCSLVDIVLDVPATVMLFFFACGLLWGGVLGVKVRVTPS